MRELAGRPQRGAVGRAFILGHRRAWLHRVADQAVVDQADARDVGGTLEGGIGGGTIAHLPVAAQVAGDVVEQLRCVRAHGFEHPDDRRQHLVVDLHRLGALARQFDGVGHHEGDRVADMPHLGMRHGRVRRFLHRQSVLAGDAPADRHPADAVGDQIGPGQHRDHAGDRQRGTDVDPAQPGMRVRRAHEHAGRLTRPLEIGHVVAAPGEEALVLAPQDRSADAGWIGHARPFSG
jgi:hypothetical protein